MARVPDNAASIGRIQRFEAYSGRSSVLKSCDLTLKCVAAGIRWRGTFRDMRGKPHLPPTEEAVFFLVGIFPSWQNFSAVSAAPGEILLVAGIRPQLSNQGRGKGGERVSESGG